jgi:hypothetical protein
MARAMLGVLAVSSLAACNWVFGLDKTEPAPPDDATFPDAPAKPLKLTYLVATTSPIGDPLPPIEAPLDDLDSVEASSLDGVLRAPVAYGADGTLEIPDDIITRPWRLVYQRLNQLPHELQLLPENAHVIEPLFGPVPPRTAPVAGAGYVFTPSGGPANHSINRVFTMGAFTEGFVPLQSGPTVTYELPTATSLSGPIGKPAATDHAIVVDYAIDGPSGCRSSTGSLDGPGDAGPPKATITGAWQTRPSSPAITENLLALGSKLMTVMPLGETSGPSRQIVGYMLSAAMPAFTRPPDATNLIALPNPAMFALQSCPNVIGGSTPPNVDNVQFMNDHLAAVVYTELTATRTVPGGPQLINGIEIVTPEVTADSYVVAHVAASPMAVTLKTASDVTVDLFGASDHIAVPDASGALELAWTPGSGAADYWEVALIEISGTTTTRKRVFVTPVPTLKIDGAYLASHHEYVFELTSFTNRPGPSVGEYRTSSLPQSSSIVNTRTFLAP